ncbi:MAG: PTS sugar transporter subunit IIA [Methylocella sp.]
MDLADLIEPDRVVYTGRASNKEQLLQDLASRAATLLNLDAQTICNALQAREELGSTGLGDGFALPHARIEGLDRLFGMFTRLNRPVHFDAIDGKPILCFSYSSRQPLAASISPRSLLSRGTCATRHSPLGCAEHQVLPLCAAFIAIISIHDLRAAVLQSDSTPSDLPPIHWTPD